MSHIFLSPLTVPYPLELIEKLDRFGMRDLNKTGVFKMHNGVDLRPSTDEVLAIFDGVCKFSGFDQYGGQYIDVESSDGQWQIRSVHNKLNCLKPGQKVKSGEKIALIGGAVGQIGAGLSQARHLHFELHKKDKGRFVPVNPLDFINFEFTFIMQKELNRLKTELEAKTKELGKKTEEINKLNNEIWERKDNQRILNEIIDKLRPELDTFKNQDATLRQLINQIGESLGLKICEGQTHGDFTKQIIEKLKTFKTNKI